MHFSKELKKVYANFGRKTYHVDLDRRASLMTEGSVAALSLLPLPSSRMCIHYVAPYQRERVAGTKVKADSNLLT